MEWLTANWFWILIGILFIGMHLFGHGGHGGHAGHGGGDNKPEANEVEKDEAGRPTQGSSSGGHQH